jgi:hypothetical protein
MESRSAACSTSRALEPPLADNRRMAARPLLLHRLYSTGQVLGINRANCCLLEDRFLRLDGLQTLVFM